MYTLFDPMDAEHSWLTVALGFLFASARRSLLEAQYLWGDMRAQWRNCAPGDPSPPRHTPLTVVTGTTHLTVGEMVPVLVVGIFRAFVTNCVLAAAAFS